MKHDSQCEKRASKGWRCYCGHRAMHKSLSAATTSELVATPLVGTGEMVGQLFLVVEMGHICVCDSNGPSARCLVAHPLKDGPVDAIAFLTTASRKLANQQL